MTKEEKSILEAFLSKTLNLGGEAISGLYNTDGELIDLSLAIEADANKVSKFKLEKQNEFNKGIEKGASKIEKAAREKYQIDTDLIGVELLDHIIELQTAELKEKLEKKQTKDDDFEKHPKYVQFKQDLEKQLKAKDQEWEGKWTQKESEYQRKETLAKVSKLAFSELENGYVLPENKDRADALKEVLMRELENGNYKFNEEGQPILSDKEGKPLEDKHGKFINFSDHINGLAGKFFDKKVANERGNAGNQSQQTTQQGTFKNQDEYLAAAKNAQTPEERVAVLKKFQASNLNQNV